MNVETTHHIDASDPDENGYYDYFYEYDIYRFSNEQSAFVARSYVDTPAEVHFLKCGLGSEERLLTTRDLREPLFVEAFGYLRNLGKTQINWLDRKAGGYRSVLDIADIRPK
ncbi:hypothetical protein G6N74_06440 [Mesorhizobium sp. CGMCC 1.15528]|uniref:Uncharacterized protein n=1 Tax=Mesorhizobium zhangyense TaxID=1776730 RepID=A0A7C9R5Y7_9HYPH|nr:hypothetical protein [Mesorhizobium zhangyense]NGN40696.1 hypothetical protein [Mesorhizobium zhangyense]